MIAAAEELRFEYAAQLRDELRELRRDLREIQAGEAPAAGGLAGEAADGRHRLGWPPWSWTGRRSSERDFPIGRRGYDPAAVDAHLRALAAEVEELQRTRRRAQRETSLASTAGSAGAEHHRGRRDGGRGHRAPGAEAARERTRARPTRDASADPRGRGRSELRRMSRRSRRPPPTLLRARRVDGRRGERAGGEPARRSEPSGGRSGGGRDEHGRAV